MTKALVLHSGGLDSSVALAMAVLEHGSDKTVSIGVNYGQRHSIELDYAKRFCDALGVERRVVQLPTIQNSILTDPNAPIPKMSYDEIQGLSPAYVPFRNGLMLSNVAAIAQAENFGVIYYGAHAEDAFNWAYPDCTPEFNGAMANAIYTGTNNLVRLLTPFQWSKKDEIVFLGSRLSAPLELTWSCYEGGGEDGKHCGECPTCIARKRAFEKAGIADPTDYRV